MVYLYDACDQISDFCHQQLLRKMRRKQILDGQKDGQTDRGKTVYPPPPSGNGGIINYLHNVQYDLYVTKCTVCKSVIQ